MILKIGRPINNSEDSIGKYSLEPDKISGGIL